jgi:hypothetical protein
MKEEKGTFYFAVRSLLGLGSDRLRFARNLGSERIELFAPQQTPQTRLPLHRESPPSRPTTATIIERHPATNQNPIRHGVTS